MHVCVNGPLRTSRAGRSIPSKMASSPDSSADVLGTASVAKKRLPKWQMRACATLWCCFTAAAVADMYIIGTITDCLMKRPDWGGTWQSSSNCSDAPSKNGTAPELYVQALPGAYGVFMAARYLCLFACIASLKPVFYCNIDGRIVRILLARVGPIVLMSQVLAHTVIIIPVYVRLASVMGPYSLLAFILDETPLVLSYVIATLALASCTSLIVGACFVCDCRRYMMLILADAMIVTSKTFRRTLFFCLLLISGLLFVNRTLATHPAEMVDLLMPLRGAVPTDMQWTAKEALRSLDFSLFTNMLTTTYITTRTPDAVCFAPMRYARHDLLMEIERRRKLRRQRLALQIARSHATDTPVGPICDEGLTVSRGSHAYPGVRTQAQRKNSQMVGGTQKSQLLPQETTVSSCL